MIPAASNGLVLRVLPPIMTRHGEAAIRWGVTIDDRPVAGGSVRADAAPDYIADKVRELLRDAGPSD